MGYKAQSILYKPLRSKGYYGETRQYKAVTNFSVANGKLAVNGIGLDGKRK